MSLDFSLYSKEKGVITTEKLKNAIGEISQENPEIKVRFFDDQANPQKIECAFNYYIPDGPLVSIDFNPTSGFNPALESQEEISLSSRSDSDMQLFDTLVLLHKKIPNIFIFDPQSGELEKPVSEYEQYLYDDDHFRLLDGRLNPDYKE